VVMYVCVRVSILPLSMILQLDFRQCGMFYFSFDYLSLLHNKWYTAIITIKHRKYST